MMVTSGAVFASLEWGLSFNFGGSVELLLARLACTEHVFKVGQYEIYIPRRHPGQPERKKPQVRQSLASSDG